MLLSVEHVAKVLSSRHATSSTGASCRRNCCRTLPELTSHTTLVLSTLPDSSRSDDSLKRSVNTAPLCSVWAIRCSPLVSQSRVTPSYEPVASREPSLFQSSVVTSLSRSLAPALALKCLSTTHSSVCPPPTPPATDQMRAVESPEPLASLSPDGDHAHVNTSFSCPSSVSTSLDGTDATSRPPEAPAPGPSSPVSMSMGTACLASARLRAALPPPAPRAPPEPPPPALRSRISSFSSSTSFVSRSEDPRCAKSPSTSCPSSARLASSSRYCSPF
mmetsp:Transcript_9814/g.30757  ORF Transcript_9814/g.30757 Transcript_9814/m.30757 type:complete len:275 (-) Transcript_9814:309-1133(-)